MINLPTIINNFIKKVQVKLMPNSALKTLSQKLSSLINSTINPLSSDSEKLDSISLITKNISRPKEHHPIKKQNKKPHFQKVVETIQSSISQEQLEQIRKLFLTKCYDLSIYINEQNWQSFLQIYLRKNKEDKVGQLSSKIQTNPQSPNNTISVDETMDLKTNSMVKEEKGKECRLFLDYSDFKLGKSSVPCINQHLLDHPGILSVNLSRNLINPLQLHLNCHLTHLSLSNCNLGNQILTALFQKLLTQSPSLKKLVLSSPQLHNRNRLTKYQGLIKLIQCSSLKVLHLSNVEIQKENGILEQTKGCALQELDLSKNKFVCGINSTIKSINLSHNGIMEPFHLPLTECKAEELNLSSNPITCFHLKDFLKNTSFPNLLVLNLSHISLSEELTQLQIFMEMSLHLEELHMVQCDLSMNTYSQVTNGIKGCRSLVFANLSRNRVMNEKVAEYISIALQGSTSLVELVLMNCQIKDSFGAILFKNIRKNKRIQKINCRNNLLGDKTARVICDELKYAKNIEELLLQENTIKYKDIRQIKDYLVSNSYLHRDIIKKQYQRARNLLRLQEEALRKECQNKNSNEIEEEIQSSIKQNAELELVYREMHKEHTVKKTNQIRKEIRQLAHLEQLLSDQMYEAIQMDKFLRSSQISQDSIVKNPEQSMSK